MGSLKSMTGFGRGSARAAGRTVTVETRSVNHRYLEVQIRAPREILAWEPLLQERIRGAFARGKIDVQVTLSGGGNAGGKGHGVDPGAAREWARRLKGLARLLPGGGEPTLAMLLSLPGVVRAEEVPLEEGALRTALLASTEASIARLRKAREREGGALERVLRGLARKIREGVARAEREAPQATRELRVRLAQRLEGLLGRSVEPARLAQEAALLAERSDVAEEIARLKAHLKRLDALLEGGRPAGRDLDFLAQELLREATTLGSKAAATALSHLSLDLRGLIDRVREQVQNVE